jgi:putative restriction endonuclease
MLDFRQKILVEKAARDAGFEIPMTGAGTVALFRSSLVPGELAISVVDGGYRLSVQNPLVMEELIANFVPQRTDCEIDGDAIIGKGTLALQDLAERIFQLSMSLPSKPLDTFRSTIAGMPTSTEAERIVVQRVGQDIFRKALDRYWMDKCAVTGISDRPLLRASHILPWALCETEDQRLDVFNGILLIAHLDAAFDAALVSFDVDGRPIISKRLSKEAACMLGVSLKKQAIPLTDRHQVYLRHHRSRFHALAAG